MVGGVVLAGGKSVAGWRGASEEVLVEGRLT